MKSTRCPMRSVVKLCSLRQPRYMSHCVVDIWCLCFEVHVAASSINYSLPLQVVLYLTRVLSAPKMIFLCSRSKPTQRIPEMVEADMPVGEAMGLLVSR